MTQSSRGCQGGLGFCRWQAGHRSCLQDMLTHDHGASFREQRGCFACLQQGPGRWGRRARSHVQLGCTSASPPHPGEAKGRFASGRSGSHTQEEPRALAELGAGSEKVGILLKVLKVGKERKNYQRITSNKKGFPCISCFHQAFGLPAVMPRQR